MYFSFEFMLILLFVILIISSKWKVLLFLWFLLLRVLFLIVSFIINILSLSLLLLLLLLFLLSLFSLLFSFLFSSKSPLFFLDDFLIIIFLSLSLKSLFWMLIFLGKLSWSQWTFLSLFKFLLIGISFWLLSLFNWEYGFIFIVLFVVKI